MIIKTIRKQIGQLNFTQRSWALNLATGSFLPNLRTYYFYVRLTGGAARLFSYCIMSQPGFEPISVELHPPVTYVSRLY